MNTPRGDRWLLLIAFVIGLSFGVHFMGLEEGSPFQIEKKVNHLAINYRSAQSIVAFNNVLYQCLTQHLEYPRVTKGP